MRLLTTKRFERDLKRAKSRGKDPGKFWPVVDRLLSGRSLEARHRPRRLAGGWSGAWECHVGPDWLLIWARHEDAVVLVRTGTHSDLFD